MIRRNNRASRALAVLTWALGAQLGPNIHPAFAESVRLDRVRIADTTLVMGSTLEQIVQATEACSMQAGSACSLEEYSHELSSGLRIFVPSFWIDRCEVSVRMYQRCVQLGRCRPPRYQNTTSAFQQADWPVVLVSSDDAENYCAMLGGTLPSEQQFEAVAAGALGRSYPWGKLFHSRLSNYGARHAPFTDAWDGFELLAPTTAMLEGRSPQGVQHLAGNVAEWTRTAMGPHEAAVHPLPTPAQGVPQQLVVKGGSFQTLPIDQRAQARRSLGPDAVAVDVGFRCVYPSHPPD